jgi:hypothetical protein
VLVPANVETERRLRDAVGGYLPVVLQYAFGANGPTGAVQYHDAPVPAGGLRVVCEEQNGRVIVRRP